MVVRRAAALVLLAGVLAGCGASPPPAAQPSSAQPPVPAAPTSAPAEDTEETALPVYYVAETPAGYRLQREFHRVASEDPPTDAVREMLASPTGTDPDYRNPWPPGVAVRAPVEHEGDVITVDLTGFGPAAVEPALGELAVQQLVFTVQGALQSTDPVQILVDGSAVDALWGVRTASPVPRGDAYDLRSLVQIDAPAHGTTVGRDVEVSGEAAVFEATLLWEVLRDGTVVRSGVASTAEGQRFAPYTFDVALEPGVYTVRVMEDDPSGGEGRPPLVDDKTITVG
ncbi:hypothetical protein BJF78_13045 [Pseudonocardia sp. CNS-139]|nr:hypothetical protein BJF78_13045 [Pseudonocardia sp. CNS-139]